MKAWSLLAILVGLGMGLSSCASTSGGGGKASNPHEQRLIGKRPISLQWISWDDFGEALVERAGDKLTIKGRQDSLKNDDYLLIDGVISNVSATGFEFDGVIETKVHHNGGGVPHRREGKSTFRLYGNRGFWRLVEMDNPAGVVDYVDIYFDLKSAKAEPEY